jgi:hypothetical protein
VSAHHLHDISIKSLFEGALASEKNSEFIRHLNAFHKSKKAKLIWEP